MLRKIAFTVVLATMIHPVSLYAQGVEDCRPPRTALSRDALLSCFGAEIAADQNILAVAAPIWQSFNDEQKETVVDRYREGMPADVSIVMDAYPRTSATLRILHADAIAIGEQEFLSNIRQDPQLEGLTDQEFSAYRDEILDTFLDGTDNSLLQLEEIVSYAPAFTEYVLEFPDDFAFAEHLQIVVNIAEKERHIAELQRSTAEIKRRIAQQDKMISALQRLEDALQGN